MPRINAPTVAEHRALQRAALIRAAKELVAEGGVGAINARTVGEKAGLARSSFYEYFPSRDDLLAAIAIEAFDEWARDLAAAMEPARTPHERLRAYVDATMRMTADGQHELAAQMQGENISPTKQDAIMAMHEALAEPLRALLEELRVADVPTAMMLMQGVLGAGMKMVAHGTDHAHVARAVNELLEAGLKR